MEINPNQGGTPSYRKSITYRSTAAPDGKVLMFEGRDEPQQMRVDGVILNQALLDTIVTWWQKRYAVEVLDDLAPLLSRSVREATLMSGGTRTRWSTPFWTGRDT
jgi:hypothetical protein